MVLPVLQGKITIMFLNYISENSNHKLRITVVEPVSGTQIWNQIYNKYCFDATIGRVLGSMLVFYD